MAMEITNHYSNYAAGSINTAKNTDSAKESNVTTSTVELKTSTPGVTKTEQIKTGYKTVTDYSKYLQGKYSYMNTGTTSMQGVPTTVSVSGAFLKKCMNDPEKTKYLEENLAAIPDCAKMAVNGCFGTLTSLSYEIVNATQKCLFFCIFYVMLITEQENINWKLKIKKQWHPAFCATMELV